MTERDRESVGLTDESQVLIGQIEATGWFQEGADIARFCLAYAVRAGVPDGATPGTETRWAAGNFDKTGEIRALIGGLYPDCQTPVRLMEHLVNEGLRLVGERLAAGEVAPADLVE